MDATAYCWNEVDHDNPIDKLDRQRVLGEKILVANINLTKGCHVATHHHESEQIAIVVSGHVRWYLGAEDSPDRRTVDMRGGEVMVLPSNVPHSVDAIEDTHIIDVLSPPSAMGIDNQGRAH
jgi:quercetin dioxygenase-like cupin family protein